MNEDKFHGFYWIPLSCSDTPPFKRIGSDHGPFVRVSDTGISWLYHTYISTEPLYPIVTPRELVLIKENWFSSRELFLIKGLLSEYQTMKLGEYITHKYTHICISYYETLKTPYSRELVLIKGLPEYQTLILRDYITHMFLLNPLSHSDTLIKRIGSD